MTHPRVMFDVGAHTGSSSLYWARQGVTVFAFEPTPELAAALRHRTAYLSNYHVIEAAVSSQPGRRPFQVAAWEDWGCSSLRPRTPHAEVVFREAWPHRKEFPVTATVEVNTIRLDEFIAEHGIEKIVYLHVDTQGEDLEVLRSLGEKIAIVCSGVIEVATESPLYEGQACFAEAVEFLKANGFHIVKAEPNGHRHEVNVRFER